MWQFHCSAARIEPVGTRLTAGARLRARAKTALRSNVRWAAGIVRSGVVVLMVNSFPAETLAASIARRFGAQGDTRCHTSLLRCPQKQPEKARYTVSNHDGSYMLRDVLTLLDKAGVWEQMPRARTQQLVVEIVRLACHRHDCNAGEILNGHEKLGVCYYCWSPAETLRPGNSMQARAHRIGHDTQQLPHMNLSAASSGPWRGERPVQRHSVA